MFARLAQRALRAAPRLRARAFSFAAQQAPRAPRWGTWLAYTAGGVASVAATVVFAAEQPKPDYAAVREDIKAILDNLDYDDGSYGPLFVRLAWHASGTYDKASNTGGSNGATMRHALEAGDGANAGLKLARDLLAPIQQKHGLSTADLWTLAGVVAIEQMGGPVIAWRPGRLDYDIKDAGKVPPNGRLPDASKGPAHVREVFSRMGFSDQEMVALIGAHALGRCHRDRSGHEGAWTYAPTTFSNEFFKLLLNEQWTPRKWDGPRQFQNKAGDLMMLPADLALLEDAEFRKWVEIYAKDSKKFSEDFAKAAAKLFALGTNLH